MKKKENISSFMKRRNKETGKVVIPQTIPSPENSGGSHKTKAKQYMIGVTKPKLMKQLEAIERKKKRKALAGVF